MKKIAWMSIAVLSLAMFTACGNNDAENGNPDRDTIMEHGPDDAYYDQDAGDSHNDGTDDAIDMNDTMQ